MCHFCDSLIGTTPAVQDDCILDGSVVSAAGGVANIISGNGLGAWTGTGSSGNREIDAVMFQSEWSATSLTYSFPTSINEYTSTSGISTLVPFTAAQQIPAQFALDTSFGSSANDGFAVEGFTNLSFTFTNSAGADLRLANTNDADVRTAFGNPPGFDGAGDSWFGPAREFDGSYAYRTPEVGDYAWATIIHEIGHTLGLAHPHHTTFSFDTMSSQFDHVAYSIMSYKDHAGDTTDGYNGRDFPQTWMMYDIAALQHKYGANYNINAGNTVYSWTPGSGNTLVDGQVAIQPQNNRIFATIWDGGGVDRYDLSAYATDLNIDLSPGGFSLFSQAQLADRSGASSTILADGNIYNALMHQGDTRSLIEEATGGSGDDTFTGNAANNRFDGGAGTDTVVFTGAMSAYTISGSGNVFTVSGNGEGTNTLIGIENARFSDQTVDLSRQGSGNQPPVVTASNVTIAINGWLQLSTFASAYDQDGSIADYRIWDDTGANSFWISGVGFVDAATGYTTTADLSQIYINGAASAGSETLWIQAGDGSAYSQAVSFTMTTTAGNIGPMMTVSDVTLTGDGSVALDTVFSVSDPEGDAITQFEIWDSAGAYDNWWANGGIVDAASGFTTTNALSSIYLLGDQYHAANAAQSAQTLYIRANDGENWGDWATFQLTSVPAAAANTAPVTIVDDVNLPDPGYVALADVVAITDAESDEITQVELWDAAGTYDNFWIGGNYVDASSGYVTTTDLQSVFVDSDQYIDAAAPFSQQTLYLRAYDGIEWGSWDSFTLTSGNNAGSGGSNVAPVVTIPDLTIDNSSYLFLDEFVTVSDANGDSITQYELFDAAGSFNNWWISGVGYVDASNGYVTSALPSAITLDSDQYIDPFAPGSTQTLSVRAFDGLAWSNWSNFSLTSGAGISNLNSAPVVTTQDVYIDGADFVWLDTVFSASDADGDAVTQFELYDNAGFYDNFWIDGLGNVDATSGFQTSQPLSLITLDSDQLLNPAAPALDQTLSIRAFDGIEWGPWSDFRLLASGSNQAPVITGPASITLQDGDFSWADNQFTVSDPDGDTITQYELLDTNGTYDNWYTIDDGNVDATNGFVTTAPLLSIAIDSDQFIDASAPDSTQTMQIRAYDGSSWSNWHSFSLISDVTQQSATFEATDVTLAPSQWTTLAAIASATGLAADGFSQYQVWDDQGGDNWWVDGATRDATNGYTTSSLGDIWLQADPGASSQTLYVRAYDGVSWTGWDSFTLTTTNSTPVVTVEDQIVPANAWTALTDVMSVTDGEDNAITAYELFDNSGRDSWWVDGGIVSANAGYVTNSLTDIWFQGEAANSTETLSVRAFDGQDWGAWENFTVSTIADQPVVSIADQTVQPGQWTRLSDVMNLSGNSTWVDLWDDTGSANWWVSNGFVDASSGFETSDLANVWFQGDQSATQQSLFVRGWTSGQGYSAWEEFTLSTQNSAPIVGIADQTVAPNQWLNAGALIEVSDTDQDPITSYEVWDASGVNNWWHDGAYLNADSGAVVTSVDDLWLQGDPSAGSGTLYVRAFDGTDWSGWDSFALITA